MKLKRPLCLLCIFCLFCALIGCSAPEAAGAKACRVLPSKANHSSILLADGNLIYQTMSSSPIHIKMYDIMDDRERQAGSVPGYLMDSGSAAYLDGKLYIWYAVDGDGDSLVSRLYRLDCTSGAWAMLEEDADSDPLIYLRPAASTLLSLKSGQVECYDPASGESTNVLSPEEGEEFLMLDTSPDGSLLYLLTEGDDSPRYRLKTFSTQDWSQQGEPFSLNSLAAELMDGPIYDLQVSGNCLFVSIANQTGIAARLENGRAEKLLGASSLVLAEASREQEGAPWLLYQRRTAKYWLLDPESGAYTERTLPLEDGLSIRSAFTDGTSVVFEAQKEDAAAFYYLYLYETSQLEA